MDLDRTNADHSKIKKGRKRTPLAPINNRQQVLDNLRDADGGNQRCNRHRIFFSQRGQGRFIHQDIQDACEDNRKRDGKKQTELKTDEGHRHMCAECIDGTM